MTQMPNPTVEQTCAKSRAAPVTSTLGVTDHSEALFVRPLTPIELISVPAKKTPNYGFAMKTRTRLTSALTFGTFFTQSAFALVSISAGEGCSIYLPSQPKAGGEYKWVGQCTDGLAAGDGVLQFHWRGAPYSEATGTATRGYRTGLWVLTEGHKTFEYALLMKDGVADSIAVREFPKGERAKAISRAETIIELEKYAIRSKQGSSTVAAATQGAMQQPSPGQLGERTKQYSGAASICGRSITWSATNETHVGATTFAHTYELLATDPVTIGHAVAPGALSPGRLDEYIKETERFLRQDNENTACHQMRYCREDKVGLERTLTWLKCIADNSRDTRGTPTQSTEELDNATPQVAGCPRYLRKSLVEWARKPGSNPQLNAWQVKNISNKILTVTYRVGGANTDIGTLNPGDMAEAWQLSEQPPYVVRDFREVIEFNSKADPNKSLQCSLAIRPR
jgi:hypothetical protein